MIGNLYFWIIYKYLINILQSSIKYTKFVV